MEKLMIGWQLLADPQLLFHTPVRAAKGTKASNLRTAISHFIERKPSRLYIALQLSLLCHILLLSITLGGQKFGMPGLNFPWKEKRLGADDLRVSLAPPRPPAPAPAPEPAPAPADTPPQEVGKTIAARNVAPMTMQPAAVNSGEAAAVLIPPPTTAAPPRAPAVAAMPDVNLPIAPNAPQVRAPAVAKSQNIPAQGAEVPVPNDAAQKQLEQEQQSAARLRQAELMADAQRESARQEQQRQAAARAEQTARSEAARVEGERQELARQEDLRREAQRQEQARQAEKAQRDATRQELERADAARLDAARKEATRQEQARQAELETARLAQNQRDAARQDATKQEAARQEIARQEAARQDAARHEAARQDAARHEAARQDAARREAARQDAAKQEAARQDAAKQEAARQEQAKKELAQRERSEQEAQRDERLRAIGKQLDAEAAQRDPALNRPLPAQLPSVSSLRRGWLLGRADPNADLVLYAQAMARKIEVNMTFDLVREAVKQPHVQPIVTVAIRADGSVEKVTFVVSSGVAAIDDAIRKVVASQAPYGAFPPTLARQYDVIEIRRTWKFDVAIRLE